MVKMGQKYGKQSTAIAILLQTSHAKLEQLSQSLKQMMQCVDG